MAKLDSDNCTICGEEFDAKDLNVVLAIANNFRICEQCLSQSDPENDYAEVKSIVSSYLKFSQTMDPELASPDVKIEPADTYIQKAIDLLKKVNPNYFVGVRKIVVDTGQGYGHVSSGAGEDPAVIHVNLSRIKSELQSKLSGMSPDQVEKEMVRQIALTISHEKGHVSSFKPDTGFQGGEQPAETEESSMMRKIDAFHKALT